MSLRDDLLPNDGQFVTKEGREPYDTDRRLGFVGWYSDTSGAWQVALVVAVYLLGSALILWLAYWVRLFRAVESMEWEGRWQK
jgi:hypothetical protein